MPNSYAADGKCHNANRGTFGHECGKPATWIGTNRRTGFRSGYCDHCKKFGDEAQYCDKDAWERKPTAPPPMSGDYIQRRFNPD